MTNTTTKASECRPPSTPSQHTSCSTISRNLLRTTKPWTKDSSCLECPKKKKKKITTSEETFVLSVEAFIKEELETVEVVVKEEGALRIVRLQVFREALNRLILSFPLRPLTKLLKRIQFEYERVLDSCIDVSVVEIDVLKQQVYRLEQNHAEEMHRFVLKQKTEQKQLKESFEYVSKHMDEYAKQRDVVQEALVDARKECEEMKRAYEAVVDENKTLSETIQGFEEECRRREWQEKEMKTVMSTTRTDLDRAMEEITQLKKHVLYLEDAAASSVSGCNSNSTTEMQLPVLIPAAVMNNTEVVQEKDVLSLVDNEEDLQVQEDSLIVVDQSNEDDDDEDRPVGDYIRALGTSADVAEYLRMEGYVRKVNISKRETERLIHDCYKQKDNYERNGMPETTLASFFTRYLKTISDSDSVKAIEYAYNLIQALSLYSYDIDCRVFLALLQGKVEEGVHEAHRCMLYQVYEAMVEIENKLKKEENGEKEGRIPSDVFMTEIQRLFPEKSAEEFFVLKRALYLNSNGGTVDYTAVLLEEDRDCNQTKFCECLREQDLNQRMGCFSTILLNLNTKQ